MKNVQLRKFDSFKFLTLTIPNDGDLFRQVKELTTAFRRLRQRAVWKKYVRGGATVIEVKSGKEGWHAHLHIIIESGYIPFKVLLQEWTAVSPGTGVYIKKIHGSQVVGYLTKYLTKSDCDESQQVYMTQILKGVRLFQPFGDWHGPIQKIKKHQVYCPHCDSVCWYYGKMTGWFCLTPDEVTVNEGISPSPVVLTNSQVEIPFNPFGCTMWNDVT